MSSLLHGNNRRTFAQFRLGDTYLFVEESYEKFPGQVIDPHADG